MPTLRRVKRPRRRVPIGDLDSRVRIYNRSQVPPGAGSVDAAWNFDTHDGGDGYVWAKVTTTGGKTVFDGVGNDRRTTHSIVLRALPNIGSESRVLMEDGRRLDVILAEPWDDRGEFIELLCDDRGDASKDASGL